MPAKKQLYNRAFDMCCYPAKEVKNENHENAVLLYTRGVEPDQSC